MTHRIFHQVAQDHVHRRGVGLDRWQRIVDVHTHCDAFAVRRGNAGQRPIEPAPQRHRLLGQRPAALDAREFEGLVDLRFEPARVFEQAARQLRPLIALGNRLGLQADAGQRRAQLVGHGGEERLHAARPAALAPVEPGEQRAHGQQQQQEHRRFADDAPARAGPLRRDRAVGAAGKRLQFADLPGLIDDEHHPAGAENHDQQYPYRGKDGDQPRPSRRHHAETPLSGLAVHERSHSRQ